MDSRQESSSSGGSSLPVVVQQVVLEDERASASSREQPLWEGDNVCPLTSLTHNVVPLYVTSPGAARLSPNVSADKESNTGEDGDSSTQGGKKGTRRKRNQLGAEGSLSNQVWSDARTSITTAESLWTGYATPGSIHASVQSDSAGHPPVATVAFSRSLSPGFRPVMKRRKLDTLSDTALVDKTFGPEAFNANVPLGDSGEDAVSDCTEDDSDDLALLSDLVARASTMLDDAVANRSTFLTKVLSPLDLTESNKGNKTYPHHHPRNRFKPLQLHHDLRRTRERGSSGSVSTISNGGFEIIARR